jgi:GxxExxY protein
MRGSRSGRYLVDFLVHGEIIVEIKVADRFRPTYIKQVLGYLEATSKPVAILANFAGERLYYKRLVNFKTLEKSP